MPVAQDTKIPTECIPAVKIPCVDPRFPLVSGQHMWKGLRMFAQCSPEHLATLDTMEFTDKDWLLCTYPKAGTTWMMEIMYLIGQNGDTTTANKLPNFARVPFLEMAKKVEFVPGAQRVYKSHLLPDLLPPSVWENKPKIVFVLRNPKDLAVSFYHFYQNTDPLGRWDRGWEQFLEMFLSGNTIYGDWFRYHKAWYAAQQRHNAHVYVVTYEQMRADHRGCVRNVANFLGKDLADDVIDKIVKHTTFKEMQSNPKTNYSTFGLIDTTKTPFIRKGLVGDWKNYFTINQSENFDKRFAEEMADYPEIRELCKW